MSSHYSYVLFFIYMLSFTSISSHYSFFLCSLVFLFLPYSFLTFFFHLPFVFLLYSLLSSSFHPSPSSSSSSSLLLHHLSLLYSIYSSVHFLSHASTRCIMLWSATDHVSIGAIKIPRLPNTPNFNSTPSL